MLSGPETENHIRQIATSAVGAATNFDILDTRFTDEAISQIAKMLCRTGAAISYEWRRTVWLRHRNTIGQEGDPNSDLLPERPFVYRILIDQFGDPRRVTDLMKNSLKRSLLMLQTNTASWDEYQTNFSPRKQTLTPIPGHQFHVPERFPNSEA